MVFFINWDDNANFLPLRVSKPDVWSVRTSSEQVSRCCWLPRLNRALVTLPLFSVCSHFRHSVPIHFQHTTFVVTPIVLLLAEKPPSTAVYHFHPRSPPMGTILVSGQLQSLTPFLLPEDVRSQEFLVQMKISTSRFLEKWTLQKVGEKQ